METPHQTENGDLLVGIDVGTSSIKALVFDSAGREAARASVPTPTHYPRPSWAYYRAGELWESTADALRRALDRIGDRSRISGVAVASIGESAVALDAHGEPTYDAIAWFDRRTDPQLEWLLSRVGPDRLTAVTGLSAQALFGLCKVLWLRDNEPDAFARTVSWLNVADYVAYRLCGVKATDYSLASRTMALDIRRREWSRDLLGEAGIPVGLFAPLVPSGQSLGPVLPEAAQATGLPEHANVSAGGHDHVCGALAVGVTDPGTLLNSLGTAEANFISLAHPPAGSELGRQGFCVGAHVVPDRYYVLGGIYTSGASIEWLRGVLGKDLDYGTLIAEAEGVPPGSLGVSFLPHLRLANPPYNDQKSRGAFVGLSADAARGVLFRAVLEGLAFESRLILEALGSHHAVPPLQDIHAIGGNTRNRLLMQIKATVLNRTFILADIEEAVALGAALLGGLGAGVYPSVAAALGGLRYARTAIEPVAEQVDRYDALFRQIYREMYPALRPIHHNIYAATSITG